VHAPNFGSEPRRILSIIQRFGKHREGEWAVFGKILEAFRRAGSRWPFSVRILGAGVSEHPPAVHAVKFSSSSPILINSSNILRYRKYETVLHQNYYYDYQTKGCELGVTCSMRGRNEKYIHFYRKTRRDETTWETNAGGRITINRILKKQDKDLFGSRQGRVASSCEPSNEPPGKRQGIGWPAEWLLASQGLISVRLSSAEP
jgi:hypothetical protein